MSGVTTITTPDNEVHTISSELNTLAKVNAETDTTKVVGAGAIKELTGGSGIKFGVDSSGNYGYYKAGADTVTPFKMVRNLGTGTSFTVTSYTGYKNFTADDFVVAVESITVTTRGSGNAGALDKSYSWSASSKSSSFTPTKSYNASTGVLTISNTSNTITSKVSGTNTSGTTYGTATLTCRVYLIA